MPRELTQLTVFASGTSETDAERGAIKKIVADLNPALAKTHGITFRVLQWPDDFRPGVNTDPQAEIDRQTSTQYDVYLGVLGAKLGTPTPRAVSGTVEEFQIALERFKHDTRSLRLLLYSDSSRDPTVEVAAFRADLSGLGVLYRPYRDLADFVGQVRRHLHELVAFEWEGSAWSDVGLGRSERLEDRRISRPFEPPGGIDEGMTGGPDTIELKENASEATAAFTSVLERMSQHTIAFTQDLRKRSAELERLAVEKDELRGMGGSRVLQGHPRKLERINDVLARNVVDYATRMNGEMGVYHIASARAFHAYFVLLRDGTPDAIAAMKVSPHKLRELSESMERWRAGMIEAEAAIQRLPPVTKTIKLALRKTAEFHGVRVAEIAFSIDHIKTIVSQMCDDQPGRR